MLYVHARRGKGRRARVRVRKLTDRPRPAVREDVHQHPQSSTLGLVRPKTSNRRDRRLEILHLLGVRAVEKVAAVLSEQQDG